MPANLFRVGGPLTDDHAKVYIGRQGDQDAVDHLVAMDYLLLIEPRQQGKTSLINQLMHHPTLGGVAFAYVDVTTPDRSSEAAWYQTLCLRIARQLRSFFPCGQLPVTPQNSVGWRDFLSDVAGLAAEAHEFVVIALDEIGAVTFPGATEFFSVLRDVYNSRQAETEFRQLAFLLSGAFHPRNLIQDDRISPFNIAQRVRLADFTPAQVRELVGKGNWTDEQTTALAERIHYWTDGQPYLTQLLCSYLGTDATPDAVDVGVERWRREDENHLPPLLERLSTDDKLCAYVERILAGEPIKFYPPQNPKQAQLELLGVIKEDKDGFCRIRSPLYHQVLLEQERPGAIEALAPTPSSVQQYDMDYERGFQALRACLAAAGAQRLSELSTLESRFQEKQRVERIFGSSENTRNERARIIVALNKLALQHCSVSFNELCQGVYAKPVAVVKPERRPTPPTPSPRPEQGWVIFKLQLAHQAGLEFEARALATLMGEPHATGRLPFAAADLIAVLKVLEHAGYDPVDFSAGQTEALQRLDLVRNGRLAHDHLKRIGQGLYDALFPGDIGVAFRMAFNQTRQARQTVFLQLRFDSDAVDLARYPWELLHDGQRHLVSAGAVELTRYITYGEVAPSLPVEPPARLLFVESRPKDLATLPPEKERLAVWNALQALTGQGKLALERLETPTYKALLERIDRAEYHLIHFDGHGVFAKRCPRCQSMNYPHVAGCHSCQTPLDDVSSQGYLAFEDSAGKADLVSTERIENLLFNSAVRLMFLSACQTGVVRGDSLFGGLGPGMIRAGVPAVVAMQFSVPVSATVSFAESLYGALARGETVSRAVAKGRRHLFVDNTWFIPTLYLRSQDDEGHVFSA